MGFSCRWCGHQRQFSPCDRSDAVGSKKRLWQEFLPLGPGSGRHENYLEASLKFPGIDKEEKLLEVVHCIAIEVGLHITDACKWRKCGREQDGKSTKVQDPTVVVILQTSSPAPPTLKNRLEISLVNRFACHSHILPA